MTAHIASLRGGSPHIATRHRVGWGWGGERRRRWRGPQGAPAQARALMSARAARSKQVNSFTESARSPHSRGTVTFRTDDSSSFGLITSTDHSTTLVLVYRYSFHRKHPEPELGEIFFTVFLCFRRESIHAVTWAHHASDAPRDPLDSSALDTQVSDRLPIPIRFFFRLLYLKCMRSKNNAKGVPTNKPNM